MCGVLVKCSAVYSHLLESHAAGVEPILPPPPAPTVKLKSGHSRSRHKKETLPLPPPPPPPVQIPPVSMEMSPVHTTTPLSRIVLPQTELQYLDEGSTSAPVTGEVQVCVESGELPVVSIQDTAELPLGENITDDIFAIMNSEGIQSADDITNVADWKNIIRDIGNMQDIHFPSTTDSLQSQDVYTPADTSTLSTYTITDADLANLQFATDTSPMLPTVIDANVSTPKVLKPVAAVTTTTPTTKAQPRPKTNKSKFNVREYDPNKHCGVVTAENPKPCTRSLTCKAHALSLRRTVEGRSKPFDTLLAEHRASRDLATHPTAAAPAAAAPAPAPSAPVAMTPLLVNASIDLSAFSGLTPEQQVNEIYTSLLNAEDAGATLPDTSSITSLLSQPPAPDRFLMPDDAEIAGEASTTRVPSPASMPFPPDEGPPVPAPGDVCWYSSCPRPLTVCTYNASHAGGAVTLGKRFATVRSDIKSSLSRSQCKASASGVNSYYNFGQNSLSLSKTTHMNSASKSNKPEVRKLIVTCSATGGCCKDPAQQTLSDLGFAVGGHGPGQGYGHGLALNGHVARRNVKAVKRSAPPPLLDLAFLDPLLADEKC